LTIWRRSVQRTSAASMGSLVASAFSSRVVATGTMSRSDTPSASSAKTFSSWLWLRAFSSAAASLGASAQALQQRGHVVGAAARQLLAHQLRGGWRSRWTSTTW
jgi:hypothetical protein